jgi:hypothetical protein
MWSSSGPKRKWLRQSGLAMSRCGQVATAKEPIGHSPNKLEMVIPPPVVLEKGWPTTSVRGSDDACIPYSP